MSAMVTLTVITNTNLVSRHTEELSSSVWAVELCVRWVSLDTVIEDSAVNQQRCVFVVVLGCPGNPDPVGMNFFAPVGEKTFDDIQTTEEAQAGADRRAAA
jgi:hypothetical protein